MCFSRRLAVSSVLDSLLIHVPASNLFQIVGVEKLKVHLLELFSSAGRNT